jgi:hypothetical protein
MWNEKNEWPVLLKLTAIGGNFSEEEIRALNDAVVGKLLCAIAYCSGCKDPDRIAVTHLITLVAAKRCREIFNHRQKESIRDRLLPLLYFPGGNEEVIKAGTLLLSLYSLQDHKVDLMADIVEKKENPLSYTDYEEEKKRILSEYDKTRPYIKDYFKEYYKAINPKEENILNQVITATFWL